MATTNRLSAGILSEASAQKRGEIVEMLRRAYWMEMETVMNYLAISEHLDGVRAREIADALSADVGDELGHARSFAARIKTLSGSLDFTAEQTYLQPPADGTDVVGVIHGVIAAEAGAIEHYTRIIEACDGVDWATQDMVVEILRDEEGHMRQFERFLAEYTKA
jgi:bacterioferritin